MRGVIKGVLAEELENSLRMKKQYEDALRQLPQGCLSVKNIKGHKYYYLVSRQNGKHRSIYKGRVSKEDIKKYAEAKKYRAKYRGLLSRLKKQIKFLRGSLRGQQAI